MIKVKSGIVVWVDVDEVLMNFKAYFHQFLRDKYQIRIHRDYIAKDWYYSEFFKDRAGFDKVFDSLPEAWPSMLERLIYSDSFTKKLSELGCRVILITHIPESKAELRIKNLTENGIYFDEIYFSHGSKKSEFAKRLADRYVGPAGEQATHLFLDDNADHIKDFLENVPNLNFVATLDYPYNQATVVELKEKYSSTRCDCESKRPRDLYAKVLARVESLLKDHIKVA